MKFATALLLLAIAIPTFAQQKISTHVGSAPFTDSTGQVWQPDAGFINTGTSLSSCSPNSTATGTPDPGLYKSGRWSATDSPAMTYTFKNIPNGTYQVNLYFSDCAFSQAGSRVFNILIQGAVAFSKFDIAAAAGGQNKAITKTAQANVTNGTLTVSFTHVTNNPFINAIQIFLSDTQPPTVSITAPVAGTYSSSVPVVVNATDNVAVAKVSATLDGSDLGTPVQSGSSYTFPTDVSKSSLGSHTMVATAVDTSGNSSSATMTFTTAVTISLVVVPTSHKVTLTWSMPNPPCLPGPCTATFGNYNVYKSAPGGGSLTKLTSTATNIYVDQAVSAGQVFSYAVTMVATVTGSDGTSSTQESTFSNEVTVTVPTP